MPVVDCPVCGEDDDLSGDRHDDRIMLTCGACGHRWDRGTHLVCRLCGSDDIEGYVEDIDLRVLRGRIR